MKFASRISTRVSKEDIKPYVMLYMMMRVNLKTLLLILVASVCSSLITLWYYCGIKTAEWKTSLQFKNNLLDRASNELPGNEDIDCYINGGYSIGCRKEGDEVYLPFSFIHKYFEVYGKLATYDGLQRFEWSHSYSKVMSPKGKYDPRGVFMYFENYNVEVRDRVKCVSGSDGVPISTQWESQGYYYPTQIAQFGLSHYSKNLTEPEPHKKIIEDSDKIRQIWTVPQGSVVTRQYDKELNTYVLKFATPETSSSGIFLKFKHVLDLVLKLDLFIKDNGSVTILMQSKEKKDTYYLHYTTRNLIIDTHENHIYYGIGQFHNHWRHLTRDLVVDLQKGLNLNDKTKKKLSRSKLMVMKIILYGSGMIDNVTLSTSEHMEQFYDAARWLVSNQNETTGGWPNHVRRKVAPGMATLEPGWNQIRAQAVGLRVIDFISCGRSPTWFVGLIRLAVGILEIMSERAVSCQTRYSSMGQGHAISVLARAFYHSGDESYLRAAIRGLRPFKVLSSKGGVAALFLGKYIWYEEYPTTPSSFVLNGFIFSLLGLYDLKSIATGKDSDEATALFNQGMVSLKSMLPLYDMGSGTTYDLRHFTLKTAPNVARWDYHSTHVNQLLLLSTIDSDPIFTTTAERWIGYMNGKRAAHN